MCSAVLCCVTLYCQTGERRILTEEDKAAETARWGLGLAALLGQCDNALYQV